MCPEPSFIESKKKSPINNEKYSECEEWKILISKIEFIKWNKLKISPPASKLNEKKSTAKTPLFSVNVIAAVDDHENHVWVWSSKNEIKQQAT